jgi:hypothetical protein
MDAQTTDEARKPRGPAALLAPPAAAPEAQPLTRTAKYEIFVEKSEQPLASENELSKAMALAAAATASFGVVKIFSEISQMVIATYVTNTKGDPVLL